MKTILFIILLVLTSTTFAQKFVGKSYESAQDKLNKEYCGPLFQSANGTILDLRDNITASGYLNILDWIQGRVAGLQVYTLRNGTRIPVIRGRIASVFIDEMQVDPGFLNALPVNDIAMIKVIKEPFIGSIGMNSAVAIYTLNDMDEDYTALVTD